MTIDPRDAIPSPASGPAEPLAQSAPLAWTWASRSCYRNHETGETCEWYHRVWQYLRLLGFISSARTNTDFLTRHFRAAAGTGDYPRVLVSATADYSMLALLAWAYEQEKRIADVTVVDRCPTALLLNRWYADRCHVPLETAHGDALEYVAERPFDLVCTHNFLGRFDAGSRARLVARWHALLRPGGLIVTTQRIRPEAHALRSRYTEDQARELATRVAAAARSHPHPLAADPDDLAHAVYEYAIRKGGYVIRSVRELTDLFEAAGFEVELADRGGGRGERERDRPSSPVGAHTYRMRMVARKP